MANIKVKRSSVAGKVPTITDLALGEIAVNTYDGLAFIKKSVDGVESIVALGGLGGSAGDLQDRSIYIATSGQTTFSAQYSVPYVDVYLNGVLLSPSDYTATNGTSVILGTGAVVGDIVQIIGHKILGVAGTLALSGGTMTGAINFDSSQTWPTFNQNTTGSAATLTTPRTIAVTGDVAYTSGAFDGSGNVTGVATLANSGVTAGTYGSDTNIPQLAVDAKGRVTSVTNVAVSIPSGALTFTGDVTGTGSTGATTDLTLATAGTAGTYTKVTTDSKGRVTSGTTLVAADIPNLDASKIISGTIDAARLPSYVDDVVEATNLAGFPATGETGKIYVALDTNKAYRWSGSTYVYITSGAVDSVAGRTGVVALTSSDVGLASVENKSSATIRSEITSTNVTSALGFTPYNSTNPSGFITSSALSSYLPLSGGTLTGSLLINTGSSAADYNDVWIGGGGGWASNESHGINTFYDNVASPTIFTRLDSLYNGTAAIMRWKNFYYSGAQTSTVMTLTATSSSTASLYVTGDVRSPIFYDSDNTAYYTDPSSTSILSLLRVGSGFSGITNTGSLVAPTIITSGSLEFNFDGVSGTQRHGRITGTAGNGAGAAYGGGLDFEYYAYDGASTYQWYTGMSLDGAGRVGINTKAPAGLLTINNNSPDGTSDYTKGVVFTDNTNGAGPWTHAAIWTVGSSGYNGSLLFGTDGDSTNNTNGITERARISGAGRFGIGTNSPDSFDAIFTTSATGGYSSGNVNAIFVNPTGRPTVRLRSLADEACELFFDTGGGVAWDISCRGVSEGKQMRWYPSASTPSYGNVSGDVMSLTQTGTLTVASDVRAPIFYDSNDTGYYINPSSSSNIGSITSNSSYNLQTGSGSSVYHQINSTSATAEYAYHQLTTSGSGSGYLIKNRATGNGMTDKSLYLWNDPGPIEFVPSGNAALRTTLSAGGSLTVATDARAPIFYDSNNTSYFLDPAASTSLRTVGDWRADSSSWTGEFAGKIQYHSNSWYFQYSDSFIFRNPSGSNVFYGDSAGNTWSIVSSRSEIFYDSGNTAYYLDPASTSNLNALNAVSSSTLWVRSGSWLGDLASYGYTREIGLSMTGGSEFVVLSKSGQGFVLVDGSYFAYEGGGFYSSSNSAGNTLLGFNADTTSTVNFNCTVKTSSNMHAAIFYDSNNTDYYVDPASTSDSALRMRGGALFGPNTTWGQYLYIGTNGNIDVNTATVATTNGNLHLDAKNGYVIYLNNYATSSYTVANQSIRSPIFYDLNDTAYYTDPASNSVLNTLQTAGHVVFGGNFSNNPYSAVASTRLMFGGGDSNAQDNYYIGTNLNNYGGNYTKLDLRWHTGIRMGAQAGYGGIRFFDSEDLGTQIFSIGETDTNVRVGFVLYTPITYDSNNTAYYLDPNTTGTSLNVAGSIVAGGNVTAYSDEKLKTAWTSLPNNYVEQLADLLSGTFTRTDTGQRQAGVGAQSLQKFLPEVVVGDTTLSVAYGNAAMVSAVALAKRVVAQDARIAHLELLVAQLLAK